MRNRRREFHSVSHNFYSKLWIKQPLSGSLSKRRNILFPFPHNKEMVPVESHDRLRPKGTRHLTNRLYEDKGRGREREGNDYKR